MMTTVAQQAFRSLVLAGVCLMVQSASAQVNFVGGTYFQDFDGLNSEGSQTLAGQGPHAFDALDQLTITGMDGWFFGNPLGSSTSTEYRAQNGSLAGSAGRGVVSFGLDGDSERALGALPTSNQVSRFGLLLVNASGVAMRDVTISFTGEQWRRGNRTDIPNTLLFEYGLTDLVEGINGNGVINVETGLNFVSPITSGTPEVALNGNLAENQAFLSATLGAFVWNPGEVLALRWTIDDITGQDDGLAIDNFSFSATAIPEPTTAWVLLGCGAAFGLFRRRR